MPTTVKDKERRKGVKKLLINCALAVESRRRRFFLCRFEKQSAAMWTVDAIFACCFA